jgi:hypothetical protein
MLATDCIELDTPDHFQNMRRHTLLAKQYLEARDKVVDVGYMGKHIACDDQIRRAALLAEPRTRRRSKHGRR